MATYVILSRFSPEAFREPKEFKDLATAVAARIKSDCLKVGWKDSYATLGHSNTETLLATPWNEFLAAL